MNLIQITLNAQYISSEIALYYSLYIFIIFMYLAFCVTQLQKKLIIAFCSNVTNNIKHLYELIVHPLILFMKIKLKGVAVHKLLMLHL